jgi:hypothetical protein
MTVPEPLRRLFIDTLRAQYPSYSHHTSPKPHSLKPSRLTSPPLEESEEEWLCSALLALSRESALTYRIEVFDAFGNASVCQSMEITSSGVWSHFEEFTDANPRVMITSAFAGVKCPENQKLVIKVRPVYSYFKDHGEIADDMEVSCVGRPVMQRFVGPSDACAKEDMLLIEQEDAHDQNEEPCMPVMIRERAYGMYKDIVCLWQEQQLVGVRMHVSMKDVWNSVHPVLFHKLLGYRV